MQSWDTIGAIWKSVWNTWNKIGKYYSFIKKLLQLLAELYFSKLTHKTQTDRLSRMNLIFSPNCPSIASFEYRLMMIKTFPEFYERSDKRGVISNEKNIKWCKPLLQTFLSHRLSAWESSFNAESNQISRAKTKL